MSDIYTTLVLDKKADKLVSDKKLVSHLARPIKLYFRGEVRLVKFGSVPASPRYVEIGSVVVDAEAIHKDIG